MEHFHVPLPKAAVNAIASTPLLAAQLMCIYIYVVLQMTCQDALADLHQI